MTVDPRLEAAGPEGPGHPYQLVAPSPWPIRGAFSALLLASGLILSISDLFWPPWHVFSLGALGVAPTTLARWRHSVCQAATP